jgi:hypothetical protein
VNINGRTIPGSRTRRIDTSLIAHLDVRPRNEDRHGRAILFEQIEQICLLSELVLGWLCAIALASFRALHVVLG